MNDSDRFHQLLRAFRRPTGQTFANLLTDVSVLVVIAHLRSDALQAIFKIFRGPPPNAPGRKATRTKHCGLTRLSETQFNGANQISTLQHECYSIWILQIGTHACDRKASHYLAPEQSPLRGFACVPQLSRDRLLSHALATPLRCAASPAGQKELCLKSRASEKRQRLQIW